MHVTYREPWTADAVIVVERRIAAVIDIGGGVETERIGDERAAGIVAPDQVVTAVVRSVRRAAKRVRGANGPVQRVVDVDVLQDDVRQGKIDRAMLLDPADEIVVGIILVSLGHERQPGQCSGRGFLRDEPIGAVIHGSRACPVIVRVKRGTPETVVLDRLIQLPVSGRVGALKHDRRRRHYDAGGNEEFRLYLDQSAPFVV